MAIVTQTREKTGEQVQREIDASAQIEKLVDEFGRLHAKKKAAEDELNTAKETLLKVLSDGLREDESVKAKGKRFAVSITAVPEKAEVTDLKRVREILGEDTFMQLADIAVGTVRDYLNPEEQEEVLTAERKGKRRVTAKAIR